MVRVTATVAARESGKVSVTATVGARVPIKIAITDGSSSSSNLPAYLYENGALASVGGLFGVFFTPSLGAGCFGKAETPICHGDR